VVVGLVTSLATFLALGTPLLLDQWIIGQASALFIFGTALVLAGICTGLFGLIVAAGLLVSIFSGDDDLQRQSCNTAPQRAWPARQGRAPGHGDD
jgi:hypothetical protein